MKLTAVTIENFRGYRTKVRIEIGDLTAFVGKNDAGKSTVLEALDVFFNDRKLDGSDACVYGDSAVIRIGCAFEDLPKSIVIDATVSTTLEEEYLLNEIRQLEIVREWDVTGKTAKEGVYAIALHPSSTDAGDLLTLKSAELKARVKKLGIDEDSVNLAVNASMRRAIREACGSLVLEPKKIPLEKEDAKKVWESLKPQLPMYALFRSDRASQDGDEEVQDPLKVSISQAIKELSDDLKEIEGAVRRRAEDVAERTLIKLKEMDASLANELKPFFKVDPRWDVFKFGFVGDRGISINKRGSGVRRLILISFFRAEMERKRTEKGNLDVIYAIEEPETSQHPGNQRLLAQIFKELATMGKTQVIVTSHTPGFAALLPSDGLRWVRKQEGGDATVTACGENELMAIANDLGVLPDRRVRALVFVEGANDVEFWERISSIIKPHASEVVDFVSDDRVALIPVGGGSLKHWVDRHYLKNLGIPEVHIYDRDTEDPPKYQVECDAVNARGDGSWAVLTTKREIENYLHPEAIREGLDGVVVSFTDTCDVPLIVARAVHESSESSKSWADVLADEKQLSKKIGQAKKRLNRDGVLKMTRERLLEQDSGAEIEGWLRKIHSMLAN